MKYKAKSIAIETEDLYFKIKDFDFNFEILKKERSISHGYFDFDDIFNNLSYLSVEGKININEDVKFKNNTKVDIHCLCVEDIKNGKYKYIYLKNIWICKICNNENNYNVYSSGEDFELGIL